MSDELFDRAEFVEYFRDESSELLDRIDADLMGLEASVTGGVADTERVNALFRSMHTIKGSAGMLEFTAVQQTAHRLESVVDRLRAGQIEIDDRFLELMFQGRDMLGLLVGRAVAGDNSNPPELTEFYENIEKFQAGNRGDTPGATSKSAEQVKADAAEDQLPSEDEVAAFEAEVARLLAEQSDASSRIASVVDPANLPMSDESTRFAAPASAAADDVQVTGAPHPASSESAASPVAPQAPTAAAAKGTAVGSTIRVDLERLDLLLDLVGELVINRTRIAEIAVSLKKTIERDPGSALPLTKDLAAASATLARITNELQESVMKARMVPIGQVFERFPRTVRDLAKATGKQMRLEVSGIATDLDKTIVDQIGEPLMHLVRNCADHGIESPENRAAAGKTDVATIRLNAYHEGNQVIIEVGDDGGGINLERIRKRGVERGMMAADAHPSDNEIIELIFTPGFSTAEQVTSVSGRGVGMDVVKRCVLDLKGTLDVDTKLGEGTTFTIRLPLTLAIIRTLLVGVEKRLFAVPLDVVIESQRIPVAEVRSIGGGEVVKLRGVLVPLVNIRKFFGLPPERKPAERVMIVIVAVKGRRVGLVVDTFEGEREIVIKPLSDLMGHINGIAGAAILGNGAISLILDVSALAGTAARLDHVMHQELSHV